jgi:mono/diheme cytochrome c family protein
MEEENMARRVLKSKASIVMMAATGAAVALFVQGTSAQKPAASASAPTFSKDVAPIFQEKCQVCHRPNNMAPMSLLTYEESRPWVRSIKLRVSKREMPPWHLDKTVGIKEFKNDISLSDEQIDTIVRWVDAGAPQGNPKDMPPPKNFSSEDEWHIGTPDLIVKSPRYMVPATGPDWWGDLESDSGLTEDRWVQAVETKPLGISRRVVHHSGTSMEAPDGTKESLSEFAPGKYGDHYPENAGRLMKAGSKISFGVHLHSVGEELPADIAVGYKFYPKGYTPKYKVAEVNVGSTSGHLFDELDIPANSVTRHDAYSKLTKAARIISYQPHMHIRGKAMTMEAIYPNGQVQVLSSVDHFDFNWHPAYVYADDVAPLLPAGTILHTIGIHDNTSANRGNPDPNMWVGFGNRTFDDMLQCHVLLYYMDDADFQQQVDARVAKMKKTTNNN